MHFSVRDRLRKAHRYARLARDLLMAPIGFLIFATTGRTPGWAGQGLVQLFCASGGRWNDLLSRLVSIIHPFYEAPPENSALGILSQDNACRIANVLRDQGYFVFDQLITGELCERLMQFALAEPAIVRPGEASDAPPYEVRYDSANPLAVRYDFSTESLINNPDVQALMADPSLIAVARNYLLTEPIADVISMWWHTAFSDSPDDNAAQRYHFDMDRIKWLKYFIYLTDVTPDSGPHRFVAKSHRANGIPPALLAKGYSRLADEEVVPYYPPQDFIEFSAPRGTVIAEDTRGLHKGQHIRRGHRLVLQIQFSNSLFGPEYPKTYIRKIVDRRLAAAVTKHPRIYSAYLQRK